MPDNADKLALQHQRADEIAHAAAMDAGTRAMKAAGRTAWSREDYNAAVAEFNRLMPRE